MVSRRYILNLLLIYYVIAGVVGCSRPGQPDNGESNLEPRFSFGHEGEVIITNPFWGIDHNDRSLFVSDQIQSSVLKFTLDGKFLKQYGEQGHGPGEMNMQAHIAVDNNRLYVDDESNARLVEFDLQSGESTIQTYRDRFEIFDIYKGRFYVYSTYGSFLDPVSKIDGEFITVYDSTLQKMYSFGTFLEITRQENMPTGMNWPFIEVEEDIVHITFQYFPVYRAYSLEGELLAELDLSTIIDSLPDLEDENFDENRRSPSWAVFRAMDVYKNRVFIQRQGREVLIDEYSFQNDSLRYLKTYRYAHDDEEYFVYDFFYEAGRNSFYILEYFQNVPRVTIYKLLED